MPRLFANYFDRLDSAYRDQSYFVGLKARLLAYFSLLLLVLVPVNIAKLLWIQAPSFGLRVAFNISMALAALLCLRWVKKGRNELAGNALVLAMTFSVHGLMLVATYAQPLSAGILIFAVDLVFLLVALVFASRFAAMSVMVVVVASQVAFYLQELQEPIAGSIKVAADTLLRDGLISLGLVFCLGIALVRMIEAAQSQSEKALIDTRTVNENLGTLVAERTRDLEVAIEKAKEASRAKSDFLANMSHEIRTPLNGIIASADLLQRGPELSPAAAAHVRLIADSGELLLKQLGDVLDFSKIEAGQLVLETHRFDLAPLVSDCLALLAARASQGGVEVDCTMASAVRGHFEGDSFRLRQVLLNLVSNAIKFTPAGGRVHVAVTQGSSQTNQASIRFEVRDTGIGLNESAMKRIFERFTQADSSTTRRYGGTGLGLAISSRIVEMMGGRISAESVVGEGSTFHFTVPLRVLESLPDIIAAPKQKLASLGLRVLVAEDNAMNRKILAAQLDALGCPYTMAFDGAELLVALEKQPLPDVVLMDCHMPNLDGWEATRRLRGWGLDPNGSAYQRQAAALPIVALTAAALPEERMRCLDAGMNDFISKPVKLAELHRTLQPFTRPETKLTV
jgi:signal transduction histidine kinase/CheY-like chemotaxis protein